MIFVRDRIARVPVGVFALLIGGGAAHAQTPGDDAALVSRGQYLARAADCMPCHSGDRSKPYSGGLPSLRRSAPFFRSISLPILRPASADGPLPISRMRSMTVFAPMAPTFIPPCRSTPTRVSRKTTSRHYGPLFAASRRSRPPIARTSWPFLSASAWECWLGGSCSFPRLFQANRRQEPAMEPRSLYRRGARPLFRLPQPA
jgi:hypothetical protein